MDGFYGQFNVNIDPGGRLALPAKVRPRGESGIEEMVLTKGLDGCLALYTASEWRAFQSQLDTLSFTQKDFRFLTRFMYSMISPVELDRQGRFLIPSTLLREAELKREALVLGAYRWIEIWNPENYSHFMKQFGGTYEEVAERLFRNGHNERG